MYVGGIDHGADLVIIPAFSCTYCRKKRHVRIAGPWTQTCTLRLWNKEQSREIYCLCLSRDQNAGQTTYIRVAVDSKRFEISENLKDVESYGYIYI
jgi:hypothetical protein